MGANKRLGRWLLYGLCLAPAVIMLGYYWLEYIPAEREYFMNLRFRSLSMIGDRLRTKIGSLAEALEKAPNAKASEQSFRDYIGALVSDLNYEDCDESRSNQPRVEIGNPSNSVRFRSTQGCVAIASTSQVFSSLVHDDLFDDVVIADDSGRAVYQRSASGPRIASLSALIRTEPDLRAGPREGSGTDADAVRAVRLDDSDFVLLLQPVAITLKGAPQMKLMAAGLVRSARLATEAHHVPPKYLLGLFAPVLIILLSGPFLKILLLTATGRLAFRDLALLVVFTLLAAGLVTVLLASWHQYLLCEPRTEPNLERFAQLLNDDIVNNLKRMRSTLQQFDAILPAHSGQIKDRTDLLAHDLPAPIAAKPAPFDFVFWTNADGCQVAKWTIKRFNTGRVDQKPEEHFRNIVSKRFWGSQDEPFTIQTRLSPTTSQLVVVLAIPSQHDRVQIAGCGSRRPSQIVSAAIVTSLPAVSAPLVPPGAGFAVFERDGRVLFHSSQERNLHENLFEEIDAPAELRAGVTMRVGQSLAAYYRGRQYQFRIQPVTGLEGNAWSLAVFRELEPGQAMIGLVWGETLTLLLALVCLMTLGSLLVSLVLKAGQGWPWRRQVDFFLIYLWPDPSRRHHYRQLGLALAAMLLISLIVVTAGFLDGYRSAGWLLPFCFLLPLAAALAAFWFAKPGTADAEFLPAGQKQHAYVVCLSLLVLLMAVVPAAGLFAVCQAFETRLYLMHWQRQLLNSIDGNRERLSAAVEGSPALSQAAKAFLQNNFLPTERQADWDGRKYAGAFWGTRLGEPSADDTSRTEVTPAAWWEILLTKIRRPEVEQEALESGALARAESSQCGWRLGEAGQQSLVLGCRAGSGAPVTVLSTLPEITIPSDPRWWLAALLLLSGVYAWDCLASCLLFNLDFRYIPLPVVSKLGKPADFKGHLLVLGLPLARKDRAVREWLGYFPPRVNLYDAHFSYNWLDETLDRVRTELTSGSAEPWVHISNLDAKLGDAHEREVVASLMERLLTEEVNGARLRLVVTSSVDPVFHFDSVLSDERRKIYEHPLPEPELQRLARILHNFRKAQVSRFAKPRSKPGKDCSLQEMIDDECRHHPALVDVGNEIIDAAKSPLPRETMLAIVAERAQALYKLFWASCTRSEKLLLIQLAQTGLVNPLCLGTLEDLTRKGLILPGPPPRIMNETFRRFLERVEGPDTVRLWESEAGESFWLIIRNVVLALLTLGLVVLALTEQPALETATAILTGVGTVLAGLFRVFGFFSGRRGIPSLEAPAGRDLA